MMCVCVCVCAHYFLTENTVEVNERDKVSSTEFDQVDDTVAFVQWNMQHRFVSICGSWSLSGVSILVVEGSACLLPLSANV